MKTNKKILAMTLCMSSLFTMSSVLADDGLNGVIMENQSVSFHQAENSSASIAISNTVDQMSMQNQRPYKIGRREQRIRFYLSRPENIKSHITGSPQEDKLKTDRKRNDDISIIAQSANSPDDRALRDISLGSRKKGLVISPALFSCFSDLLKRAKKAGDNNPNIMENGEIDEFNLFILPVQDLTHLKTIFEPTKLQISPVAEDRTNLDPAINIQVPFLLKGSKCLLPTTREIGKAMLAAYNKGDENRIDFENRVAKLGSNIRNLSVEYKELAAYMSEKSEVSSDSYHKCYRKSKTDIVRNAKALIDKTNRIASNNYHTLINILQSIDSHKVRSISNLQTSEKNMADAKKSRNTIVKKDIENALNVIKNCNVKPIKKSK